MPTLLRPPTPPPSLSALQLARMTPGGLAWHASRGRWVSPKHLTLLNRKLLDVAAGRVKRLAVSMPPRHGKSELVSRYFPAWYLGSFPDRRVILTGYEADFAAGWGRKARDVLATHGPGVFGVRVRSDSSAANRWEIADRDGGMVTAGVGGPITGKGADVLVIDDPVKNAEDARSPVLREKHKDWYKSTAFTRLEPGGAVVLVMTRWHQDDLAGWLLGGGMEDDPEPWEVVCLPAIATGNGLDAIGRAPGEALWPARYSVEALKAHQSDPYWWSALYQQDPRAEGGTEWGKEFFPSSIWFDDWPRGDHLQLLTIALDPSKGKDAKSGDYSALVALARDRNGCLWVEANLARRPLARIVTDGIEFARSVAASSGLTVEGFGVESDQFQELLADEFVRQTQAAGFMLPLYKMLTGGVNKQVRIRRLSSYITRKQIRFRNTPGTRLLVRQLQEFPTADHDDGPDSLEYALRLAIRLWNGKQGKR